MKPPKESADIVLNTLKTIKKSNSPVAYLNRAFTQPVITNKESRQLLNAINYSFRRALDDSRHPNDVVPPASIHNSYANKADDHVYKVVTGSHVSHPSTGKHDSLRGLIDPGTIGLFEQHIWQGTATIELAVECLKKYISQELQGPVENHRRDGGLIMVHLLKQQNMLDRMLQEPSRAWLIAALLLSSRPMHPFGWLAANLKQQKFGVAKQIFKEILQAYRNIYSSSINQDTDLFLHILRFRDKDYRQKVSLHPRTKIASRLDMERLAQFSELLESLPVASSRITSSLAHSLYNKSDTDGKKALADALHLWNTTPSYAGAWIALKHFGNPYPGVDYLISLGSGTIEVAEDGAVTNAILGLQVVKELLRENQQEMATEAMRIVSSKLLSLKSPAEESSTLEGQLGLLKGLLQIEDGEPKLSNEYAWNSTIRRVKSFTKPEQADG